MTKLINIKAHSKILQRGNGFGEASTGKPKNFL